MKKLFILVLILTARVGAQGIVEQNFSHGTNGNPIVSAEQTNLSNSFFGYRIGNNGSSGCNIATSCDIDIGSNNGTFQALKYTNTWGCADGIPAGANGGPSALYLDYNTSVGGGHQNIFMAHELPSFSGSQPMMGVSWKCIPAVFNTSGTFDDNTLVIAGGASKFTNLTSDGTHMFYGLEGTCGQNGWPVTDCGIQLPLGQTFQLAWFLQDGACSGTQTTVTGAIAAGCLVLALYDRTGSLIGFAYGNQSGTPGVTCPTCQPSGIEIGDLNGAATSAGHVYTGLPKFCFTGCSASQFPLLETTTGVDNFNHVANGTPPWDGILTPNRAIDWRQSGFPGDTLFDGAWTQCGTTLIAGNYTGAAITTTLSGCGANTFYRLGSGTFNIDGQIKLSAPGKVVLRGSGANSTFLVHTGANTVVCSNQTSFICMVGDGTSLQSSVNICTLSGNLAQGSTQVTMVQFNGTGNCPSSISTTTPTILAFGGCDTGYSGTTCGTGNSLDNGGDFICDQQWSSPNGCAADPSNVVPNRKGTIEWHIVTNINGSTYTISPPILNANLASLPNPQAVIFQPIANAGVENLSLDLSAVGAPAYAVDALDVYKVWITGIRTVNSKFASINIANYDNTVVESNYVYKSTNSCPSCYGIRPSYGGNSIIANNIVQQVGSPFFEDGDSSGMVFAYNACLGSSLPGGSSSLFNCFDEHWVNRYNLFEGNYGNQISCGDDIHGTTSHCVMFRNFLTGWDSVPSAPVTGFTNAGEHFAFSRYLNQIGQVGGTPGYHTNYSGFNANGTFVYSWGQNPGGVATTDTKTLSTSLLWASYDVKTAANRFCGNALDTNWAAAGNCNSVSESPVTATTWPGFIPVKGDTTAGQDVLPASLVYTSRPSWWANTIPFPAIGPDVTGGNVGQCSGTINTVGQMAKVPALTNAQCVGTSLTASQWGGHVNAIPAMVCALNVMGMPADGSGPVLTYNAMACTSGSTLTPPTNLQVIPLNKPGD